LSASLFGAPVQRFRLGALPAMIFHLAAVEAHCLMLDCRPQRGFASLISPP